MIRISKLVALVLTLAVLASPAAAAFAACWTHSAPAMKCAHCAEMMSAAAPVQTASDPAPCCKFSSDKSIPASVPSLTSAPVAPFPAKVAIGQVAAVATSHTDREAWTRQPADASSHQAVLCIFLI